MIAPFPYVIVSRCPLALYAAAVTTSVAACAAGMLTATMAKRLRSLYFEVVTLPSGAVLVVMRLRAS